ncbi:MAG: hydantoinase B/oxoprolinase family protein [Hyphomicrobiaceae bacterium]|nr:hydantoinase B/oxoprolinase family protein [Hyphomicrobiaceae bacterium]
MSEMHNIRLQVMWNRLLSVVEEQAQTLIRTSFSTSAREAGDISAGIFDVGGRMLAQAVTGTAGHVNSMARSVKHFLAEFPAETMRPGDVYITNDPWKGTGHLHDLTMVTPTFIDERMVALFASTTHVVDIGGIGMSPDGRQIFHEGCFIPIVPLISAGRVNEWLLKLIRHNVREPVQVEGDIYALVACNQRGADRLLAMMDEYGLRDLDQLGDYIITQSHAGMTAAINKLPQGTWRYHMRIDGYDAPIDLKAALTIANGKVHVDYAGSSGASSYGINCPMCYTEAYTAFAVKCVAAPSIPNNTGTLDTVTVSAPERAIMNAQPPSAVVARSTIGHMLPDVVFGCLHQAMPGHVPAEGTSNLWNVRLAAGPGITGQDGTAFTIISFHSGGAGARPTLDGLSATPFPSGVKTVPVEITETITPLVVWRKDYRQDSGGAGRQRGGIGQVMVIGNREPVPYGIHAVFERIKNPPRGREGGLSGAAGRLSTAAGRQLKGKGFQVVEAGDRLVIEMPGGGGYGEPLQRDLDKVQADVRSELISRAAAERDYKVVLRDDGTIDKPATEALRRS